MHLYVSELLELITFYRKTHKIQVHGNDSHEHQFRMSLKIRQIRSRAVAVPYFTVTVTTL
jgi:hypothetical protein